MRTGMGKGSGSRKAFQKLKALVYKALGNNEEVKIRILFNPSTPLRMTRLTQKQINYECSRKNISHTPKFFRVLRSLGLAFLTLNGSVITASVVLATVVVSAAGYLAVAEGVLFAVSKMSVDADAKLEEDLLNKKRKDNENLPRDGIK
jgi:hypothetical protein